MPSASFCVVGVITLPKLHVGIRGDIFEIQRTGLVVFVFTNHVPAELAVSMIVGSGILTDLIITYFVHHARSQQRLTHPSQQ
jgi:hypothetical protein